jgi:two-component system LytT family response regulator
MAWSALIIDDEPPARKRLAELLRDELDVIVTAQCSDGTEAEHVIRTSRPDLLFLDIQMPEKNGLDLVATLAHGYEPAIIFVTAHEEYAVRAFTANAVDYLLKPFSKARFRQALAKARWFLKRRLVPPSEVEAPPGELPPIMVKGAARVVLLRPEQIDWVEAAGNYVILHEGSKTHWLRATLRALEAQLPERGLLRLSRSAIVNTRQVTHAQSRPGGCCEVTLRNGQVITATQPLRLLRARLGLSVV